MTEPGVERSRDECNPGGKGRSGAGDDHKEGTKSEATPFCILLCPSCCLPQLTFLFEFTR